ncbi:hypothetical protein PT285_06060 [Lactobacillus sp. ESL0791]|uniref:hypothetical protein n=1 Tax=Lactobacillus sp. ESL0791 TaxID=2983234 RepID=UPI0023F6A640|nr:hypothetical protein [Lactobacillus sp. ESL0791]MDF7638963.1 hypothetical protein [Lactobacillus sp. ESL0791]
MAFDVVTLNSLLNEYSQENIKSFFENFSSLDKDVENFLKQKAIQFEKIGLSRTTLVFTQYKNTEVLVGYFAISGKPLIVKKKDWNKLSSGVKRKLLPIGYKSERDNYVINSILLGQFSKNNCYQSQQLITGKELLSIAYATIKKAWEVLGGTVLYLEARNEPHIQKFYTSCGFSQVLLRNGDISVKPYVTSNGYHLYLQKLSNI